MSQFTEHDFLLPAGIGRPYDGSLVTPVFMSETMCEPRASGHWLLGQSDPSLSDLTAGLQLLPIGVPPTLGPGSVITAPEAPPLANALVAPLADAAEQTLVVCFAHAPDANSKFVATQGWTNGGADGGQLLWWQGGANPSYLINTNGQGQGGSTVLVPTPPGAVVGNWLFAAVASTASGAGYAMFGGQPPVPAGAKKTVTNRNVSFGGADLATDYPGLAGLNMAEVIIFPFCATPYFLAGVYARSRVRLAGRPAPIPLF